MLILRFSIICQFHFLLYPCILYKKLLGRDEKFVVVMNCLFLELDTKELLEAEGYLLSNMAAVKAGYLAGAYQAMVKAMKGWTTSLGAINVIHGPIFDHDIDGHQDPVAIVL